MPTLRTFTRFIVGFTGLLLAGPTWAAVNIDASVSRDQNLATTTVTTPTFSTTSGNELLLAFVSADQVSSPNTVISGVSGGGLNWAMVQRTNVQAGTAEIWRAFAASPLTGVTVTATLSQRVASSITVLSFTGVDTTGANGAGAIGAVGTGNGNPGAPTASLVTTRGGSLVLGVGNDFDRAIARTVGSGQVLVHQDLATVGDTYWVQRQINTTAVVGTTVVINDTAPTGDRYNLSIVEVVPPSGTTGSTFTISGTVTPATSGSGTSIGIVQGTTTTGTATVDANGNYSFSNLANGTYTLTPSKSGFTFTPASLTVQVNNANSTGNNFVIQAVPTYSISGTISPTTSGSGSTVTLSGSGISSRGVTANSSGVYTFTGLANGTYVVTPSKSGFTFTPSSLSVPINNANSTGNDFTIQAVPTYSITGTITPTSDGSGSTVTLSGGGITNRNVTANSSGVYTFTGLTNGSYVVTPNKSGFSFTPTSASVTVNGANPNPVNFTIQANTSQLKYPNFSVIVPTSSFSIVQTSTGREFRYTHDTFNGGAGPLEIQPFYNSASGNYQGYQHIYTLSGSSGWTLSQSIPIAGTFIYHPIHGHFHFPLASFGLYAVAADGSIGAPVVMSPKVGFCIGDSFIYDSSLPNAGAFGNWGSCSDPNSIRGLSIGAVDEYDHNDPGQSIPIDGLPDGTYWFRAIVDPNNFLAESDKSNNETDVKVQLSGNTVQVLQTVVPVLAAPPSISMATTPAGPTLSGNVTLTATTSSGNPVQYLIDGQLLGSGGSSSPYSFSWDTTTALNGTHWLSAQTTDATGRIGTSPVVIVTVANGTPPTPPNSPTVDRMFSQNGHGTVSASVTTTVTGDVLVAFVAAGGPVGQPQSTSVAGGNLGWTLVQRSNSQAGTAEIWTAKITGQLSNVAVTSTLANASFDQSLVIVAFSQPSGAGASASRGAAIGPAQVGLTSTQAASWTWGVGVDIDSATAPTVAGGQTMQSQWVDTGSAYTFWVQSQSVPVANAGSTVSIADVAPIPDRWNMAAVEVLPQAPQGPDVTPPTVQMTSPTDGSTVYGTVTVSATAADDQSIPTVIFYVDNLPLGNPVTVPPFMTSWDTMTATFGPHTLTASAADAAGNTGNSAPVSVNVDNTHPPNVIGTDVSVSMDGQGTITTPPFSTATAGELLVAFVAFDGPSGSPQSTTVSGAGLSWTLLQRSNTQSGTAEIWSARASGILSAVSVTARCVVGTYHGSFTVITFTNALGTGLMGRTGAPSGAPDISLPGVAAGNWVFAVGNDWDRAVARTPVSGQVLVHQRVDTSVGDTFWVQSTASPSTASALVDIHDSAPTTDQWNYAAVEIVATHQ